jgi:hypothetical protein
MQFISAIFLYLPFSLSTSRRDKLFKNKGRKRFDAKKFLGCFRVDIQPQKGEKNRERLKGAIMQG